MAVRTRLYLQCLSTLLLLSPASADTVLGAFIFSRHGDRTSKSTPPAKLTNLGYDEVYTSGTDFRGRYIASDASSQIAGISADTVKLSQLSISAPLDNVLMSSAVGFSQGLYPPVGPGDAGVDSLRNGTRTQAPLNGYQIIPVTQTSSGSGSEDSAWLQGSSGCANALLSSNSYFASQEYMDLLNSTKDFYNGVAPMVNQTFSANQTNYKNAYTIWDLLNVANIHNATFPSSNLLTNDTFYQLSILAHTHEWNLAYNESEPVRSIDGATLAGEVVQALNSTITTQGKKQVLTVQFGAYATFLAFFGLANLTSNSTDFYGVPDYASTMTFEMYTTADSVDPYPSTDDIRVRFLFQNGTSSSTQANSSAPTVYPLFGGSAQDLSWNDFSSGMNKFAVTGQSAWCTACGNSTGVCANQTGASDSGGNPASAGSDGSSGSASGSGSGSGGVSPAVGGVIGAMVTLAVILGVEALVLLVAGLRVVSKKRLAGETAANGNGVAAKASE